MVRQSTLDADLNFQNSYRCVIEFFQFFYCFFVLLLV